MTIQLKQLQKTSTLEWQVAQGLIDDASAVDKFGYNPTVGNTAFETVWDGGVPYVYIASAGVASVASDDSDDNGGTVEVQGLDANYQPVSETITIGSTGTQLFYRVFRASLVTAATGDVNQGDVTITVDSKSAAIIRAEYGQTLMALYTIPRGKRGYLLQIDCGASKDLEHEIILRQKHNGGAWNTKTYVSMRGGFISKINSVPIQIPAEADIEIQAKASATSAVGAGFELILVDD